MAGEDKNSIIRNWSDVLINPDRDAPGDGFKEQLARFFYSEIQRTQHLLHLKKSSADFLKRRKKYGMDLPMKYLKNLFQSISGFAGSMIFAGYALYHIMILRIWQ